MDLHPLLTVLKRILHDSGGHGDGIEVDSPEGETSEDADADGDDGEGGDDHREDVVHEDEADDEHADEGAERGGDRRRQNRLYLIHEGSVVVEDGWLEVRELVDRVPPSMQHRLPHIEIAQGLSVIGDREEEASDPRRKRVKRGETGTWRHYRI